MQLERKLNLKNLKIAIILFFLSITLFLINIQFPRGLNFDEFHYIPAAKQFLEMRKNQNTEHPPLGKLIIAGGIAMFGDKPIGWRFMSTVFGALTLVGMFYLGLVIFRKREAALWVALITLANQLLYVQSRIAMLDTFMFAFLVWGMVAFCSTWEHGIKSSTTRKLLITTGIFFGLAIGTKWSAITAWMSCLMLVGLIRLLQYWRIRFERPHPDEWFLPDLWKGITAKDWAIALGVIPVFVYALTFLPYLGIEDENFTLYDLIQRQFQMWDGQLRVVSPHPYMSHWFQWPLLTRPIWYAFDREGIPQRWVRGVILLGNPLVMWAGFVAVLVCARDAFAKRARIPFLIAFFYSVFYLSWIVVPRRVAFYYYYYPAGMMLSLALAYVFYGYTEKSHQNPPWLKWAFLASAFALFIYFFPILAALKLPSEAFRQWMWFQSWI